MTDAQARLLHKLLGGLDIKARPAKLAALSHLTRRDISTSKDLTEVEFRAVVEELQSYSTWTPEDRAAQVAILTRAATEAADTERNVA